MKRRFVQRAAVAVAATRSCRWRVRPARRGCVRRLVGAAAMASTITPVAPVVLAARPTQTV